MNRAEPLMALAAITKSFTLGSATIHALRGVDMSIRRGETVAVTGPSGSGKSTLLNLCGLLDQPDVGEVWFDGAALRHASEGARAQQRRAAIGFVFQSFNLVPVMSAADNVDYPLYLLGVPPRERAERVARALDRVGLAGFASHRPDQLSGGQRQRVAIARAIVKNPRLVIADEPTANLDAATAAQVISLMKQLAHEQGTSFVIATHDDRMLAHCDRALMLDDGVLAGGSYAH